jgi:hypothetical protein
MNDRSIEVREVDSFKRSGETECGGWDPHPTLPVKKRIRYAWREFELLPGYNYTLVRVLFKFLDFKLDL